MPTYIYTRSDLKSSINSRLHGKIGLVTNINSVINDIVREVWNLGLTSAKRKAVLAPNLFNDIYQYTAPSDIDGRRLVDIQPQSMDRSRSNRWEFVSQKEFDWRKQTSTNLIAFAEDSFTKTLLVSMQNGGLRELSIASLQSLTSDSSTGASWTAFGNATNLQTDTYNFIKGNGSVEFDLQSSGTTAGVELTTVNTFDLTYYKSAGSIFTWVYLNTASLITNVILRVGNDSSNYYSMTATTPNDGTSFINGWNLVRFNFNSKTTTGTVTDTTCDYAALYLTKTAGTADTGYRFNWLDAKQGNISNLIYYSKYPWISNTSVYKNSSTTDTDYLICDTDEFNLFVEKGVEVCGLTAREYVDSKLAADRFGSPIRKTGMIYDYKRVNPDESLQMTTTLYDFGYSGMDRENIILR